jgi:hypothetical protein
MRSAKMESYLKNGKSSKAKANIFGESGSWRKLGIERNGLLAA